MLAEKAARHCGLGKAIIGSMTAACAAPLFITLAAGKTVTAIICLTAYLFLNGIGVSIYNIHVVSLRQAITPERLFARMNASYRFIVSGAVPIGALIGGFLGDAFGLRPALAIGAVCMLSALLWVSFSPIPRLRTLHAAADERV